RAVSPCRIRSAASRVLPVVPCSPKRVWLSPQPPLPLSALMACDRVGEAGILAVMEIAPSEAIQRADESVATRFSRIMKASTSPLGILTDPPMVAVMTAPLLLALLGSLELGAPMALAWVLGVVAPLPIVIAIIVTVTLSSARDRVVAWLARQPFPVENMNAVLNGVGETLEVRFRDAGPGKDALKDPLERVSPD